MIKMVITGKRLVNELPVDLQSYQKLREKAVRHESSGRFSCARVAAASLANQTTCIVLAS